MTEDTITAQPQPGQPQEMLPSAHTHYRKKPVPITAVQFDGTNDPAGVFRRPEDQTPYVVTVHGQRCYIEAGDWIIPEPDGVHFYPCKPDIFADTYEPCRVAAPESYVEIWGNGLGLDFSFKYGGDMTRHANFLGWWLHRNMSLIGGLAASEFNAVQQARSEGFVDAVNQIQEQQAAAGEQQDQQDQQPASGPAMH